MNTPLEDNWYRVAPIDERTFAIGEPRYPQRNWSYLFVGDKRALLFDTGSYFGDITNVVARRVTGQVTVLPSHMHYDHLGNVERYEAIVLPDLPVLRACEADGFVVPREPLFLGDREDRTPPRFPVMEWLAIGTELDLGGIHLQLLHTPGHSPDSVSLWQAEENRLFAADFLYPGELYAQVPGASLSEYRETAERVLVEIDAETTIFGAHGLAGDGDAIPLPVLGQAHVVTLIDALDAVRADPLRIATGETEERILSPDLSLIIGSEAIDFSA